MSAQVISQVHALTVTLVEVLVGLGIVDGFFVEINVTDGSPGKTTYYIENGGERRVLKVVAIMPAMGGATMTQELVE